MRRSPRIATLALAAFLAAALTALGCASRKQVSTTTPEPPPPASTETQAPPPPPPSSTESTEPTEPQTSLQDAYFDFDDAALRADAKTALENNARYMERNSRASVVVEGHCDERGSVEYNLALGERRANSVRDYLVSRGISAERFTTVSYGEERPKYDNAREETRRLNRRAALLVRLTR